MGWSSLKGVVPMKHKKIYKSLVNMVRWTNQLQLSDEARNIRDRMSYMSWANEYCTLKFCLPRGSGHSHFAVKLCNEFVSPIIIAKDSRLENLLIDIYHSETKYIKRVAPIITLDYLVGYSQYHDGIIVDNTSLLSNKEIDNIYNTFSPIWTKTNSDLLQFVFLQ